MRLNEFIWQWLQLVFMLALLVSAFITIYYLTAMLSHRSRKGRIRFLWRRGRRIFPERLLRILGIHTSSVKSQVREQLLRGCGLTVSILAYEIYRKLSLTVLIIMFVIGWLTRNYLPAEAASYYCMILSAAGCVLLLCDKAFLEGLKRQRSHRIIKEVFAISTQLLYYSGSRMNLHSKLAKCIPYSATIRNDMRLLVNEWYQDSEMAIRRFKIRLGTDEGYSFAETINSLRQNNSESYYKLLKQRLQDYKEKLEIAKETRKETTSYLLFVIAGLPILNTFRVFIYPWVSEGRKLFDSLQ